jgi:Protein of unknown function (DUF3631)
MTDNTFKLVVDNDNALTPAENAVLDAEVIKHDSELGLRMLGQVHQFIGRFVAYPSDHAHVAHALWIVHTHLMDKWDSTPRIAFLSAEPASGKSRALEITNLLVPRPMQAVNISPAALFRSVGSEDGLPTILFDEIDTLFGPKAKENEEIRGLFNAGHRRGQKAYRAQIRGTDIGVEAIEAFSALAVAGLGWLPDTIMSRSVIIRMRRRHPGERVEPFRPRLHEQRGFGVRALIEQWAASAEINWPELPPTIEDRDADVWESLIAVADAVGGEWPALARKAAVALVTESKEREPSLGIRLLADLRTVFGSQPAMFSKDILDALRVLDEAPWDDLKGKPLNERGLAHRLRQYGIQPKSVRLPGVSKTSKGYHRDDLHDAWARYLPALADTSGTSGTSGTRKIEGNPVPHDVPDSGGANTSESNDVPDVPDVPDVSANGCGGNILELPPELDRRPRRCVNCMRGDLANNPLLEVDDGEVHWLHRSCLDAWKRHHKT